MHARKADHIDRKEGDIRMKYLDHVKVTFDRLDLANWQPEEATAEFARYLVAGLC